jgi:hypothetical protein
MTKLQACVDLCEKGIKSTHTVTIAHRSSSEPQPKKQKPNNILTTPELVNNYALVHEPFEWNRLVVVEPEDEVVCINKVQINRDLREDKSFALQKYRELYRLWYKIREQDFKNCKGFYKRFRQKYPEFKHRKHLEPEINLDRCRAGISSVLKPINSDDTNSFTENERKIILDHFIKKIQGIYAHAQAGKTAIANAKIRMELKQNKAISICIAKNAIDANDQWFKRLTNELEKEYPHKATKDLILLLNSSNYTGGDATYCKNYDKLWSYLKKRNDFKLVFICSNSTRLFDVLTLSRDFQRLRVDLQRVLHITHDEAHNVREGIPAFRSLVEDIISQPNIKQYCPMTATRSNLYKGNFENLCWIKENLDKFAIDYSKSFSRIKSTNPIYSSIHDAVQISFEELQEKTSWKNHNITRVPQDIWGEVSDFDAKHCGISLQDLREIHPNYKPETELEDEEGCLPTDESMLQKGIIKEKNIIESTTGIDANAWLRMTTEDAIIYNSMDSKDKLYAKLKRLDYEKRGCYGWCRNLRYEVNAINNGINCLHMNQFGANLSDYYQYNTFNMHIISTPLRCALTCHLGEEAVKMDYNPIVLLIYRSKKRLLYDGKDEIVDMIMGKGEEFNVGIQNIIYYLENRGVNTKRPFLIIGNYFTNGESISYVNSNISLEAIVRGNIRLISTNPTEDYQEASRSCFKKTRFLEEDPNWTQPTKFIVGPEKYIKNIGEVSAINDKFIDDLGTQLNDNIAVIPKPVVIKQDSNGIIATPVKIVIDWGEADTKELRDIASKTKRTVADKEKFLRILQKLNNDINSDCEIHDKIGKFKDNIENFTLNGFRAYKKGLINANYRFDHYEESYTLNQSYMNAKGDHVANQCEVLMAFDKWILPNGKTNSKSIVWVGYKY